MDSCSKGHASKENRSTLNSCLNAEEQFKQLRPSKELLYYRRKMLEVAKEMQDLVAAVERCKDVCEREHQLEIELQKRHSEIYQLQEAVSDLQVFLYQEREQVLKANGENERLRIRALQDRKKINYLLSLTCTSEEDLNLLVAKPWRQVVQQHRKKGSMNTKPKKKPSTTTRSAPSTSRRAVSASSVVAPTTANVSSVDVDTLVMENESLHSQLEEQTRLFQENFHTLLKDRELQREEANAQVEQCQEKVSSLISQLSEARERLCDTVREMLYASENFHKDELKSCAERELFLRKIQGVPLPSPDWKIHGAGSNRDSKHAVNVQIKALKDELLQRDQVIKMFQDQCVLLEVKTSTLQQQLENNKIRSKDRNQKLLQVISVLKSRYSQLDQRRRLEAEGFRSDIRLLRGRLTEVERNMIRIARSTTSVKFADTDILASAADTLSKAELLGQELLSIQKKVTDMEKRLVE